MNTRTLGEHFVEARKDISMSEVRQYQEFRNERDILDVTDGNRRNKKYAIPQNMPGIIQNTFGRQSRASSAQSCDRNVSSLSRMFQSDSNFYSKSYKFNAIEMNTSRQRDGSVTIG